MQVSLPAVPPRTAGARCGMGCSRGDAYPQAALETTPAIQHTAANNLAPPATPTRRGGSWLSDGFSPKGDNSFTFTIFPRQDFRRELQTFLE